jgi:WD40 repeat protein
MSIYSYAVLPSREREICSSVADEQNTGDRSKSPGAYVATGSRDKTICLWDTQTGQLLKTFVCPSVSPPLLIHPCQLFLCYTVRLASLVG